MRYLAIDYGLKRVGLALSDTLGRLAFPLKTLKRSTRERLFAELAAVIEQEAVDGLVVGLPRGLEWQTTLSARQAENFAASLAARAGLPVFLVDEALTSVVAEEKMRESGAKARKRRQHLDQQAAVEILETFLHGTGAVKRIEALHPDAHQDGQS